MSCSPIQTEVGRSTIRRFRALIAWSSLLLWSCLLPLTHSLSAQDSSPSVSVLDSALRQAVPAKIGPDLFPLLGSDLPIQKVWQDGPYLWVIQREPLPGEHLIHQDVIQVIDLSKLGSPRRVQTLRPLMDAGGAVKWPTEGTHGMELSTVFLREGWLYAQDQSSFAPAASYYTYRWQTNGTFVFAGTRTLESPDTSAAPLQTVTSRMYPRGGELFVAGKVYSTSALSDLGLPLADGYLFSRYSIGQGSLPLGFPNGPGTQGIGYSTVVGQAGLPENQALGTTPARKIHDSMLFFRNAPEWPMFDHVGSTRLVGGEDGQPRSITYEWIELTRPLHSSPLSVQLTGFLPEASLHVPMSQVVAGLVPRNERLSQTLDLRGLLLDAMPGRQQTLIEFLRLDPGFDENLDVYLRRLDLDRQVTVREALRAISQRQLETRLEGVIEGYFNRVFAELSLNKVVQGSLAIDDFGQRMLILRNRLKDHFDVLRIDAFVVDYVFKALVPDLPFADDTVRQFVDRFSRSSLGLFVDGVIQFINLNPVTLSVEFLIGCDFPDDLPTLAQSLMKSWSDGIRIDWDNRIYYEGLKIAAHYAGFEGFSQFEIAARQRFQAHLLEVQAGLFGAIDPVVAKIEGWSGLRKSFAIGFYNKKLLALVADLVADGVGAVLRAKTHDLAILDRTVFEVIGRFGLQGEGGRLRFDQIQSGTDLGAFLTTPVDTLFEGLELDLGKLGFQTVIEAVVIDHFRKTFPELNLNLSLHDNLMDYLLRAMDFSRVTQGLVHEVLGEHFDERLGGGSKTFSRFMERFAESLSPYRPGDECWMNLIRMSRWLQGVLALSPDPTGISQGIAIDLAAIEQATQTAVTESIHAALREAVGQYVGSVVTEELSSAGSVNTSFSAEARRSVVMITHSLEEELAPYRGRLVQLLGSHGRGDRIVSLLQVIEGQTPELLELSYDRVTGRHAVRSLGLLSPADLRPVTSIDGPNPRLSQGFLGLGSPGILSRFPRGFFALDAVSGRAVFFQGADGNAERFLVSSDRELAILWSARQLQVGVLPLWTGLDDERRDRSPAPEIGTTPAAASFAPGERLDLGIRVRGAHPMAFLWTDTSGRVVARGTHGFDLKTDGAWVEGLYRLVATNAHGVAESAPLRLTRRAPALAELTLAADGSWLRVGVGGSLEIPITGQLGDTPLRYTLMHGSKAILATTNRTLKFGPLSASDSGRFSVKAEGPQGGRMLGAFHLSVIGRFDPPRDFRPTFATTNELAQLSRLFDRVEVTDPRSGMTRGYTISREVLPPYNRANPSAYQGFIGERGYAFINQIPAGETRPLSGRLLGGQLVKVNITTQGTNRWVLQKSAALKDFTPVNNGQGSMELLLPAAADQEFYRIDPLP